MEICEVAPVALTTKHQIENMDDLAVDYKNSAKLIVIENQRDYEFQVNVIRIIKEKWAQVEQLRKELKKPVDDAAKNIQNRFKPILDNLKDAEGIRRRRLYDYDAEQVRIAAEQKAVLDEEIRKKQDRIETEAIKAREDGNEAKAVSLETQSNILATAQAHIGRQKTKGVAKVITWKYRVIDLKKVPREWMMINDKALGQFARSTKGQVEVEGIEFYSESNINIRKG